MDVIKAAARCFPISSTGWFDSSFLPKEQRGRAGAVERVMTVCQIEYLMEECALCSWKALNCTCIYYGSYLLMHEYAAMSSYQSGYGVYNIHIYLTK